MIRGTRPPSSNWITAGLARVIGMPFPKRRDTGHRPPRSFRIGRHSTVEAGTTREDISSVQFPPVSFARPSVFRVEWGKIRFVGWIWALWRLLRSKLRDAAPCADLRRRTWWSALPHVCKILRGARHVPDLNGRLGSRAARHLARSVRDVSCFSRLRSGWCGPVIIRFLRYELACHANRRGPKPGPAQPPANGNNHKASPGSGRQSRSRLSCSERPGIWRAERCSPPWLG